MKILRTLSDLRQWRAELPPALRLGFVPTMGALHAGHLKLIETGRRECDRVVVSIFVNPLQFGPNEDFVRYPRPFEQDRELCETAGVDALFVPEATEFYAKDHATYCEVEGFDQTLCGASRPGHFRGVCTVVLKLFNLVQPHRAYFGKKDIQQGLILCKMVADLSLNLEMVLVETVREASGLALSSRNIYLSDDEKERATALYRALCLARTLYQAGESDAEKLKAVLHREVEASRPTRIDYIEIVSQARLQAVSSLGDPVVVALAVFYGKTRLIDNCLLP